MKIFSTACFLALTVIFCLNGCVTRKVSAGKAVPVKKIRYDLQTAVRTATERSLDMRVLESLQLIAREHVEKSRLLELPGMIYDLPRRLPGLTVENDYRLTSLDHALESCRILTTQAKNDLHKVQAEAEKRKIALEQAVRWSKLAYVNNLKKAGINTPDIRNTERDITLELAISSGIPEDMIDRFDFSSLPKPFEIPAVPVPEYIRKILKSYHASPDAALRFADIVYRLPTELLHRSNSNFSSTLQLVQASGGTIKQDIIQNYAQKALQNYRKACKKLETAAIKSPALFAEKEQALLEWRIAFFRNKYNTLSFPEKPDKKEMTFLTDLISLQGK
ncbi:MAG: hypothetical protein IKC05_00585 [Lentisphaeria bacterium]|nr:hypothetical protein [Lentisphaeria bacterium]